MAASGNKARYTSMLTGWRNWSNDDCLEGGALAIAVAAVAADADCCCGAGDDCCALRLLELLLRRGAGGCERCCERVGDGGAPTGLECSRSGCASS
eukprot:15474796-Alexandrium_andersonii.AAC.1